MSQTTQRIDVSEAGQAIHPDNPRICANWLRLQINGARATGWGVQEGKRVYVTNVRLAREAWNKHRNVTLVNSAYVVSVVYSDNSVSAYHAHDKASMLDLCRDLKNTWHVITYTVVNAHTGQVISVYGA